MADQAVMEEKQVVKEPVNPSGAPELKPGDGIIVSDSLDIPEDKWNTAVATEVFADQGTCNATVFLPRGTRLRWALHYRDDPRLTTHPHWLPPDEPDSGVWQLSRDTRLLRKNQQTLARVEELLVELSQEVTAAVKQSDRNKEQLAGRSPNKGPNKA